MIKGGYQILDLTGMDASPGVSVKIDGIYQAATSSLKPLLITNVYSQYFGGILPSEYAHNILRGEGLLTFNVYNYNFTIRSDDTVTVPE